MLEKERYQMNMTSNKKAKNEGKFFAIDSKIYNKVTELKDINVLVAYLVIANGSGADNLTSSWSAQAIHKYTGISRKRASQAISRLIEKKIILKIKDGTKPQYKITEPKLRTYETKKLIWLPNEIITGVKSEQPPITKLRSSQDFLLIKLFIDLYSFHDLVEDQGVSREIIHKHFDKTIIGSVDQYDICGFNFETKSVYFTDLTFDHQNEDKSFNKFWNRLRKLELLGLIYWPIFLCESDSDGQGEYIHALGYHGVTSKQEINDKSNKLALLFKQFSFLLLEVLRDRGFYIKDELIDKSEIILPILKQYDNANLISVIRLRYRPKTKKTACWYAQFSNNCDYHIEQLNSLIKKYSLLVKQESNDFFENSDNKIFG